MPNCDFYAFGTDHKSVLEYVFSLQCRVFELSSSFDTELVEFKSTYEIEQHFTIEDWSTVDYPAMLFQLYPENSLGKIHIKRVELDPTKCDGATFRFKCSGWGMIQLYLYGLVHGELRESHTNHNSERRAQKWGSTYPELGDARDWDFRLVNSTSRKVNQFIKANSIANCGSRPIMKSASQFFDLA